MYGNTTIKWWCNECATHNSSEDSWGTDENKEFKCDCGNSSIKICNQEPDEVSGSVVFMEKHIMYTDW